MHHLLQLCDCLDGAAHSVPIGKHMAGNIYGIQVPNYKSMNYEFYLEKTVMGTQIQ